MLVKPLVDCPACNGMGDCADCEDHGKIGAGAASALWIAIRNGWHHTKTVQALVFWQRTLRIANNKHDADAIRVATLHIEAIEEASAS